MYSCFKWFATTGITGGDFMENNLRILMARHKKTLKNVSEDTGISMATLSGIKREATKNPDSQTLIKLAKYFNVTLDELVTIE